MALTPDVERELEALRIEHAKTLAEVKSLRRALRRCQTKVPQTEITKPMRALREQLKDIPPGSRSKAARKLASTLE